ncbi:hypothetical protein ACF0H5_004857 [Mactra antiquata]
MNDQSDVKVPDCKSDDHDLKSDKVDSAVSKEACSHGESEAPTEFECPVCLQTASFPVQLPCRHIFCFLCVKGVANRSKRCAMCRQEIPADFFNDPKLLCEKEIKEKSLTIFDDGYQWFYEGRNGWWQYDDRTSNELEKKYKNGDKVFELLIAGFLYVIDLESMRQCRRNDQTRRRRIRRDMRTVPDVKGIAGLRFGENQPIRPSGDGGESNTNNSGVTRGASSTGLNPPLILPSSNDGHPIVDDSYLTPSAPNNTPQTPMTPADSQPGSLSGSQEDLSIRFQLVHLNSHTTDNYDGNTVHPMRNRGELDDLDDSIENDDDEDGDDLSSPYRRHHLDESPFEDLQADSGVANTCPDDDRTFSGLSDEEEGDTLYPDHRLNNLDHNPSDQEDDNDHGHPRTTVHHETGRVETYL